MLTFPVKNSIILFLILITVYAGLLLLFSCENATTWKRECSGKNYVLSSEELSAIQDGDIIMRQGYGIVSTIILKTLKEDVPVSHIGVISQDSAGDLYVIHSVSQTISDFDGIQIDNLERFISHSRPNSVLITRYNRPQNNDNDFGRQISYRARYYLDKKVPFDHSFNFEDSTAFFCSELVWRIFMDLFDDNVFDNYTKDNLLEKLKFEPFHDTSRFEIIINHHDPSYSATP